jgi:hypothetical protein
MPHKMSILRHKVSSHPSPPDPPLSFWWIIRETLVSIRRYCWGWKAVPIFLNVYGARNRFQGMNSGSLCSLAGRYDSPIPPQFLAPIGSSKIPDLDFEGEVRG